MKAKHTILLIALGFCLSYLGSLSQIMHRGEGQVLLILGTVLKVVGILWLAYKVVSYGGFRKFMERYHALDIDFCLIIPGSNPSLWMKSWQFTKFVQNIPFPATATHFRFKKKKSTILYKNHFLLVEF
jgi:hypothetical protein